MKFIKYLPLVLFLTACNNSDRLTPEQQVRSVLEQIEQAAEARSLSGVMQHFSEDFKDHQGLLKKDIGRLLQLQFIRHQRIFIYSDITEIDIVDNNASVEMIAVMASSAQELSLSDLNLRADRVQFSVLLEKQADDWQVVSVSWQRNY